MTERGFGRLPASDDRHLRRFSLTPETMPTEPTPVVFGINWREGWQRGQLVQKDGAYWLPPRAKWGAVAGGHAICSEPPELRDRAEWWQAFDQGNTPRCVDWAISRQQTLRNRRLQAPGHLYPIAQQIDEWPGEDYEGTSVRAGEEVARTVGMWRRRAGQDTGPFPEDGISTYRWGARLRISRPACHRVMAARRF
jgi:hypothetical protein